MVTVPDSIGITFGPRRRKALLVVPADGHLFEEPGTLDEVKELAIRWFRYHPAGEREA